MARLEDLTMGAQVKGVRTHRAVGEILAQAELPS
jgi:hypothetical protein